MFFCVGKWRSRIAIALVLLAVCLFCVGNLKNDRRAVAVASYEWGVHFEKKGEEPVPNLSSQELLKYDAYYVGDTSKKILYLTFDAGYENGNTAPILDALKKHNAPGAFFLVGPYIKENPDLVKRMVEEGHIVGNHTYHHPDMRKKGQNEFARELSDTEQIFYEVTGRAMDKFYRPPEGKFTTENLQWAKDLGFVTVFWSTAYVDWNVDSQPSKEYAMKKIEERTFDGSIILLHVTSATNAAILDEQLTKWEAEGYTFAPVSALKNG